jgi:synaptotagmin-12
MKRGERNPVYNEAMIFSVPPYLLNSIQVRLTVMNSLSATTTQEIAQDGSRKSHPIGHVIVGSRTDGKGLLHWHQMLTTLRKQVAFFHPLRRSINKQQSLLRRHRFNETDKTIRNTKNL